ncbi:ZIP-like iron-zinc transporter [Schizopora paradoxa]|uniref:ZIP-like iron-zinc transporter n=1 Tax=Schizopora paradoxa TaxID=27342 RepID=A0A0H2S665_9AGAM|nr:ZIP-like iron-zinc transporter [Schizopora paradoxa]
MTTLGLQRRLLALFLVFTLVTLSNAVLKDEGASSMGISVREHEIQSCAVVEKLNVLQEEVEAQSSPIMRQVFAVLFPFSSAGWNAVLGTFYISSVPNFILAFIPSQIHPDTLNTMTAFATGGLLSDVFLHLVPHAFMGERQDPGVHFVMVEEKRNILIGLGIFVGFAAFFVMEKTLRVLGGEEGEAGHSHSHSHSQPSTNSSGQSTGVASNVTANGLRSRSDAPNSGKDELDMRPAASSDEDDSGGSKASATGGPSKLSAYLNLFGDFVHNITDGLAMAASFYSSPIIGATTTLACFAHEIPHEIADYSILVRSGFSKRQAMQSQYLTAVGAFVRTFMGIAIHNVSATTPGSHADVSMDLAAAVRQDASGLLGTTVQYADLVIPFVAGGFMYIGAVAVLPTLLQESKSAKQALREFAAMAFGVVCMFFVAWNE